MRNTASAIAAVLAVAGAVLIVMGGALLALALVLAWLGGAL